MQPIVSLCVPRLFSPVKWGLLFKLPQLLINEPIYSTIFKSNKLVTGSKNPPTIGSYLIRSKYTDNI